MSTKGRHSPVANFFGPVSVKVRHTEPIAVIRSIGSFIFVTSWSNLLDSNFCRVGIGNILDAKNLNFKIP